MNNTQIMNSVELHLKEWILKNQDILTEISDKIWKLAEPAFEEFETAKLLENYLEQNGFTVKKNLVKGLDTAFTAEWTNGNGPVIGILGEYDALVGMGNELCDHKAPTGKCGHACGHNLIGVGSMGAAVALAYAMKQLDIKGTVKYFGCPAEEGGGGKVFMVRDGIFENVDATIGWHPVNVNYVSMAASLAMSNLRFKFHGKAAHAGSAPHLGRSALDAGILMDVGINYMREHMPSDVRIHSIIANGGSAVNVVPDYTEILYCVRAPRMETVYEMIERVKKVAEGAALATETTVEYEILMSYAETLANKVLSECLLKNFKKVGAPVYSDKDYEFAKRINTETTNALRESNLHMYGITDPKFGSKDLHDEISDNMQLGTHLTFSTDSGDVCWQAPSCQLRVVGQPIGTSNHSWQVTVCAGSEIGHKSMICAAETMALTAADILTDEDLLSAAQAEFRAITEKKPYKCLLSKNLLPKDVSLNKK